MIAVYTSVWIEASRNPRTAATLNQLIDADEVAVPLPVWLELWAGAGRQRRAEFQRRFAPLAKLVPTEETWAPMPNWIVRASDAGERFGIIDLLIASLAVEIGGLVWSLDSDFERMEKLQFVSLYSPPQ
jgi:predicted nucleic acid-binding protein